MGWFTWKMETTILGLYRDYIGLYWGYFGIMEKKMEATIIQKP